MTQRVTLGAIWAQSLDGVIGDGAGMPWHLPEDLKHFKEITYGHPIIMGRRTWESLPTRPLPGRANHVLSSRQPGTWSRGAYVSRDIPDLETDAWIIGGAQVYEATIDEVDVIERTLIDVQPDVPASRAVYAPRIDADFALARDGEWQTSETGLRYKFQRFERI
ncbi:dihydrofolate reductase [Corynebacterium ureicelerivorans]